MAEGYLAAVELGGTTCVAAIAEFKNPTKILESFETETTIPKETLPRLSSFLKEQLTRLKTETYRAIGIASFGPLDLRKGSKTYGFITTTPKERWRNVVDLVSFFKSEFGDSTAIGFDTDVNAPALAEMEQIATGTPNFPTVVYITVGTGVGIGAVLDGSPIHGLLHPEGGHMVVPPAIGETYPGGCAYNHRYCVEGMVHSKAIAERAGVGQNELRTLSDDHEVWNKVGYYLGALCLNVTYLLSPHVIVLGGGIMKRRVLYDITRRWFKELLKGYLDVEKFKTDAGLAGYIRESVFGDSAGIVGALELARKEAANIV